MNLHDRLDWNEQNDEVASGQLDALKKMVRKILVEIESIGMSTNLDLGGGIDFYDEVKKFEISLIRSALLRTGGHQSRAARLLGIKKTTLNAKIKLYNIDCKSVLDYSDEDVEEKSNDISLLLLKEPQVSKEINPQWFASTAGEQENALR